MLLSLIRMVSPRLEVYTNKHGEDKKTMRQIEE
jgi:hypothetical protein